MNDDEVDELLIQAARDYNEPAVVPREEMWGRISAARSETRRANRQPRRTRTWVAGAVAAAAVLAIGVSIGRRLERSNNLATTKPTPVVATVKPESTSVGPAVASTETTDSGIGEIRAATKATQRRAEELASRQTTDESGDSRDAVSGPSLAYRLVVLRHLAGSEAMITTFRSSAERGQVDAEIAGWSRELLATTRLLEASSATKDPTMKRLLGDLDLVITQIAQYASRGTNDPDELDLIEQSIHKRGVIAKLRRLPDRDFPAGT
jgi:hypothetical protein